MLRRCMSRYIETRASRPIPSKASCFRGIRMRKVTEGVLNARLADAPPPVREERGERSVDAPRHGNTAA